MTNSVSGIYAIYRKGTSDCYIGQSINIRKRWSVHKNDLLKNKHAAKYLQHVVNKHGFDCLEFKILEIVLDVLLLCDTEQKWMDALKPIFNSNPSAPTMRGFKHSESVCEMHRQIMLGNKYRVGKEPWMKGRQHTEEAKAKISVSKIGTVSKFRGVPRSEEVKRKVSAAKMGIPWSETRRAAFNRKKEFSLMEGSTS